MKDALYFVASWILPVFVVCLAAYCIHRAGRTLWLLRHGIRTTAQVVRIRTDTDGDGDPTYFPVVAFSLPDGKEAEAEPSMASTWQGEFTVGVPVEIYYNPAAPTKIIIKGHDSVFMVVVLGSTGLLLLASSVVMFRDRI